MELKIILKLTLVVISQTWFVEKQYYSATADFITTQSGPKPIWNETALDHLKKDLLVNYDRYARPAQHYDTTGVKIGLTVLHIEIDESKSIMSAHAWLSLIWNDPKLQWNSSDYNNLDVVRLADLEIWQPDLYLYNSASGAEPISRFGNPQLLVYENGEVLWVPFLKLTSLCEIRLQNWPYDQQRCSFKFGSWTHNGQQLKLSLYNERTTVELELVTPNSLWNIINTTAEIVHSTTENIFGSRYYAQFSISVARVSEPYQAAIVTPLYVIVLLILMQFWLPPNAKERLFLNGIITSVVVMYLLYFTNFIAIDGFDATKIVSFYTNCLLITSVAILHNIATFTLSTTSHARSPPWIITKHLRGFVGKCLLLAHYEGEVFVVLNHQEKVILQQSGFNHTTGGQLIQKGAKYRIQGDWILLTVALDRIVFVIYFVICIIPLISYGK